MSIAIYRRTAMSFAEADGAAHPDMTPRGDVHRGESRRRESLATDVMACRPQR